MICEHKQLSFITSNKSIGSGINHEQSVHICKDCGQFQVFSRVNNNESQIVNFKIIDEKQLEFALKFINQCRIEEGQKPLELVETKKERFNYRGTMRYGKANW